MFSLWVYIVVIFIVLVVGFIAAYRTSVDKDQKCAVALAFLTLFVIVGCYACIGQEGDLTIAAVFLGLVLVLPVAVYSLTLKIRIARQKHAALLNSGQDAGMQAAVQRKHSAAQTSAQQKKAKKRIAAQQKGAKRQAAQLQKSAAGTNGRHEGLANAKEATAVASNNDEYVSMNNVSEVVADALSQNEVEDEVLFDADVSNEYGQSESTEMETSDVKAAADVAVPTEAKKSDRAQETYHRPQRNHRHDQWHEQRHETAPMYSGVPADDTIGRRRAAAERQLAQAKEAVRNRQPQELQPALDQKIKQDKPSTSAVSPDYVRPPMYRKTSFADARERAQVMSATSAHLPTTPVSAVVAPAVASTPIMTPSAQTGSIPVQAAAAAATPAAQTMTVPSSPAATQVVTSTSASTQVTTPAPVPVSAQATSPAATPAAHAQATSVQETQAVQASAPTPTAPVQAAQAQSTVSTPIQEVQPQTQTTSVPTVTPTTQAVQTNSTVSAGAPATLTATMATAPTRAQVPQSVSAPVSAVVSTSVSAPAPAPAPASVSTTAETPTSASVSTATSALTPQPVAAASQAAFESMNAIPIAASEPAPAHTIPVMEASSSNSPLTQKSKAQETERDQKMRVCNNFAQMADMLRTEGSHEKALALYARAFHFAWDDVTRRDIAFKIIASAINSNHPEEAYHFANILSEECGTLSKTEMVKLSFILKSIQKLL